MVAKKKMMIIVMDGLGDRGCKELGGLTPLQYTDTPNLDWFTANGTAGIVDVIRPGVRPGSDTAHLSILGYDPLEVYTGRGPFEAAGIGLIGKQGDVAFRCNFSTVDENLNVTDRRAGRIKEPDTTELVKTLEGLTIDGIQCIVKEGTEHRAALILRGPGLNPNITDADPHELGPIHQCKGKCPEADFTADIVNKFVRKSYELMSKSPVNVKRREAGLPEANILLPRGAGKFPDIIPFNEANDLKGACVAGVGMIKGICGVCGLDVIDLPAACTGGNDSDFTLKAKVALETLKDYDFILMNCKAPDVCGHDSNPLLKSEIVKRLDAMAGYIKENMPEDFVIAFTADHSTPCQMGDHSADPVPLTIYTEGTVIDDAEKFSETGCAKGRIGRIRGHDILPIMMDMANRTEKFGA